MYTLNELERRFGISKARRFINNAFKNCFIFKIVEGLVYKYLPAPDLP